MTPQVLTLNAGSSSLKFALYNIGVETELASGIADGIGASCTLTIKDESGNGLTHPFASHSTYEDILRTLVDLLLKTGKLTELAAVGHRVVHGGVEFTDPVIVNDDVLTRLTTLEPFAPLHQPHNLAGIKAARAAFPDALQVACFDTAFHRNHPFVNDVFALPRRFYEEGVRRYGFHGLSYQYVSEQLAALRPDLHAGRVIICHLGNGASACALSAGQSIASTMGFSALDGLPMGTRCGQLDPGVVLYLMQQKGMTADAVADLLYKQSGLLGLSGISNDMRVLEASDDPHARAAIDYFVFRIRREIAGLAASMGGLDALIFCGGIGENSRLIRQGICENMDWIGITLDHERNASNATILSGLLSPVAVMVIRTNEENVIARAAFELVGREKETSLRGVAAIPPL